MIGYRNVREKGLYGIGMLKKDDRIFVFYNMGDKENVGDGKLREAAEKGISLQNIVLYKRGKSVLDFHISLEIEEICGQGIHQDIAVISGSKNFQALCEYWMYVVDIRKRIILRNIICRALFDFEFDRLGCHDSCSDFRAIYPRCIRQYDREMSCKLCQHLRKYMEIRRDYVNVTSMQDQREYYAILRGCKPGIYDTVNDYERNIIGYSNAFDRALSFYARAEEFFLDYLADSCLVASVVSINELRNGFCYRVNQSLQYENKTIMKENLTGYACGGVHADTRRLHTFWIIASKDGIVVKIENIIHENEKIKKIGAIGGELLAGRAVLAYTLKYEHQEIEMYCSHVKVASWTGRDVRADKLPYRLHAVIGKAKERLKVAALHFQQENWNL